MYDLLILTFNKRKYKRLRSNQICIKGLNKTGRKKKKYYFEIWPFINNCYGILYKLFTKEGLGEFECCDEMFEMDYEYDWEIDFKQFVPSVTYEYFEDCVPMRLIEGYKEEFIKVLDLLLSGSPISTIAFLCTGQSLEKEIIVGTLSRDEFVEMLCSGKVRTNICYLISNNLLEYSQ